MDNTENNSATTGSEQAATCHLETQKLQALAEVCKLIGQVVHLDTTLGRILKVLHHILHMERATLVLLDTTRQRLVIRASHGLTVEEERRGIYGLSEGICGQIFQSGLPCIVPDINSEPLFLNRTGARSQIKKERLSFLGVPIQVEKKSVGVLTVDHLFGPDVSFEEDMSFLEILATLIGQFLVLHDAISRKEEKLIEENRSLKAELHSRFNRHYIIGDSPAMQEIYWLIEKIAPSKATVLLLGQSGTGKELVARALHETSTRKDKPYIKVNCAALPENLLESELLGHDKGAFTGATATKPGKFELADGGTVFLDEIGELPILLQAKLLRVIQEQQFERIGGTRTLTVDVRIIAATNVDLQANVEQGLFRSDLYYRLNVVPIQLPALHERRGDIPLLIDHFLRASNERNNRDVKLTRDALDFLTAYDWPGNVRELQNFIERLVILADRQIIQTEMLKTHLSGISTPAPQSSAPLTLTAQQPHTVRDSLEDLERQAIEASLRRNGWVQARAARELGLTQRQIGYRIKKFNLSKPAFARA